MSCVYWIHSPDHTNCCSEGYVGISDNFDYRMYRHKSCNTNDHLSNAIKKHGWENLIKQKLLVGSTEYCLDIEKRLRPNKNIGWNIAIGGGKPIPWKLGEKLPDWIKQKISDGRKGIKFSDAHKKNLSKAKIGKNGKYANNFKGFIKAFHLESNQEFILDGSASMKSLGLHNSAVYRCLNGKQSSHKGYTFQRIAND